MVFSPNQIEEILSILDKYTTTFIARKVGTDILSKNDYAILKAAGIDVSKIGPFDSSVSQAFQFGMLSDILGDKTTKNLTYPKFKEMLNTGTFVPLNKKEKGALLNLKHQTYSDIKNLTSKMRTGVREKLVFADKLKNEVKHSKTVTDAAKKTIEHRRGVTYMVSELGDLTKQWDKDLGRIADYVLHSAFDEGRAAGFEKKNGVEAVVYKDVYPGACAHCIKAYLEGGIGSTPKLFSLSDLKANGTNIGRKAADWKPVVGPLHPWCRCTLEATPFGFTLADYKSGKWEWNGTQFVRTKGVAKPKVDRPKVRIKVNGKESFV